MQQQVQRKPLYLAGGFFGSACFFKFVLIGYQTVALLLLGGAVLTLLLGYIPIRWVRRMIIGCTIVGIVVLFALEISIVAASFGDEPADADYVIVLGAGVTGRTPSLSLYQRLLAAQAWLEAHPDSRAILSGGQGAGEDISEAEAMYQWLTANGIAAERLQKEEQSSTTRENFQYSVALLQQQNGGDFSQPVAIVSSEYHLYRAKYLARQMGLTPLGVPAKTTLPVLRFNYFVREGAAVGRLFLLGY